MRMLLADAEFSRRDIDSSKLIKTTDMENDDATEDRDSNWKISFWLSEIMHIYQSASKITLQLRSLDLIQLELKEGPDEFMQIVTNNFKTIVRAAPISECDFEL